MTDEQDPTGMRHLLAGLKESAAMPDDLNDRIRASLEQEQAAKEDPSTDEQPVSTSAGEGRGRGGSRGLWVVGLTVAVLLAAVGVFFALGQDEEDGGSTASGSGTNTPTSEGGSDGSSASTSHGQDDSSSDSTGSPSQVPAFAITDSGTDYSRGTLPEKAAQLQADPEAAPELDSPRELDGMDTAAAVSDCLARLGYPELLPIIVDVATFDGEEGLLLMGQEAPEGKVRAWAVTTGCEPIWGQSFTVPTS